ncbi:bifunctional precorrin-2 dehydrogenase/sirohydrochlorin ferrochelatase, partial [Paenibacillus sp. TAF43_2]|uniref:precorrin-2 dehydrogenase/sirohydrochlorin ferrochelatase family protein n=1 Tax=Paenibacillus sp. TAF43_2 TaxID=3233069 RepID=UPI003F99DAC4
MNGLYPIFMQLKGKRCVIIGGGSVAQRKLQGLLAAGADEIWVISPSLTPQIVSLASDGDINWFQREYNDGDLAGASLVFAATNDKRLNAEIAAAADRLGILVNAVDDADKGSFIS